MTERWKPRDHDRRWLRIKPAARLLGVPSDLLFNLVRGGAIPGALEPGQTGQPVAFVYADDLDALRLRMTGPALVTKPPASDVTQGRSRQGDTPTHEAWDEWPDTQNRRSEA